MTKGPLSCCACEEEGLGGTAGQGVVGQAGKVDWAGDGGRDGDVMDDDGG